MGCQGCRFLAFYVQTSSLYLHVDSLRQCVSTKAAMMTQANYGDKWNGHIGLLCNYFSHHKDSWVNY